MSKIATLKTQAKHLARALGKQGIKVTLAQALEAVAGQYGFDNWDALAGVANAKPKAMPTPTLADVGFTPDHIWVEEGSRRTYCNVAEFDEGLMFLHDPVALEAFFDKNPELYSERMETTAMRLEDNGGAFTFSFKDLLGLRFEMLGGKPYWYAPAVDTYLELEGWEPLDAADDSLAVPEMVKSAAGTSLVRVPSSGRPQYDAHVIVPAHLDPNDIAGKLSAEIARLKALDEPGSDSEYTEEDLVVFAARLGCKWVVQPVVASETWD